MALQTSGSISLNQIFVEANSSYASGQTSNVDDTNVRLLVEATGKDINKTAGTQISFSDFYGATKFDYTGDDGGAPAIEGVNSGFFTQTNDDINGTVSYAGTQIQLAVASNGTTCNIKYRDVTNTGTALQSYLSTVNDTFNFTINPYYDTSANAVRNANHGMQWRWVLSGLDIDFTQNHSNESFNVGYFSGTTFVSMKQWLGTGGDQTSASYTSSWQDWNPIPNVGLNFKVFATANESTGGISRTQVRLNTGGYMRIEIRDDGRTQTASHLYIRKSYVSSNDPLFDASSFEDPGGGS